MDIDEHKYYPHHMPDDMLKSKEICDKVMDDGFADDLYRAMSNMRWYKLPVDPEELTLFRLSYNMPKDFELDEDTWTCTWRGAGGHVAWLRAAVREEQKLKFIDEDYMDYYAAGNEGTVTPEVKRLLANINWHPVGYPDDY